MKFYMNKLYYTNDIIIKMSSREDIKDQFIMSEHDDYLDDSVFGKNEENFEPITISSMSNPKEKIMIDNSSESPPVSPVQSAYDQNNILNIVKQITDKKLNEIETLDNIIEKLSKMRDDLNPDKNEPILNEENKRFTIYPIKYHNIWDMYKKQMACFWKVEEIDFSKDQKDFESLNDEEQHFLKWILAFFAASDGIVNFNITERFTKDVKIIEAQVAYNYQTMMENIHGEAYSLMLDNIIKDENERDFLFNAIENIPSVKRMADWAFKWVSSSETFAHRVVAFAIVEGVFFSGAFAAIFWFKKYKNKGQMFLQGLTKSNEFIARDEGMHCDFACMLYSLLDKKLEKDVVYNIMDEAVEISKAYMDDALPYKLLGMNAESMATYIEYIGDRLLVSLNYPKKYKCDNPFKFMETIGLPGKTNFFEMRPTEYQSAHTNNANSHNYFVLDDDF